MADFAGSVELSFKDPTALNPYNALAIDGLDTDLIFPKYYGTSEDAKLYNLLRRKRTIVVQAGLNPNYTDLETYSQLRDDLYRTISASRSGKVLLRFKDGDTVVAVISGTVSKFEANHFDREQQVRITLECKDPMLKSPARVSVNVTTLDPANSIIQDDKSTAPHGLQCVIKFLGSPEILSFDREELGAIFTIRPRGGFNVNDRLHISSEMDNKHVYLVRGGQTVQLGDVVDQFNVWPLIYPGENIFQLSTPSLVQWQSISHYETYWGV